MASWPEGDGAGMSTGSCWPVVSVSAQVVGVSLAVGVAGVWAAAAPLGVPSGKDGRHPSGADGDPPRPYPGRAPTPLLGSPDRRRHASALPAGFSPARGVINVPPPAPVRCACAGSSRVSYVKFRNSRGSFGCLRVSQGFTWASRGFFGASGASIGHVLVFSTPAGVGHGASPRILRPGGSSSSSESRSSSS